MWQTGNTRFCTRFLYELIRLGTHLSYKQNKLRNINLIFYFKYLVWIKIKPAAPRLGIYHSISTCTGHENIGCIFFISKYFFWRS